LADTHTAPAENAQVVVAVEEGVIMLDRQPSIGDGVGDVFQIQIVYQFRDLAPTILRAVLASRCHSCLADGTLIIIAIGSAFTKKASVRVLRKDEREDFLSQILEGFCLGAYDHALGDGHCAGCGETAHVLDFHHTESTGTDWCELGMMAQGRDVDAVGPSGLEDRHPRLCLDFDSVDCQ